MPYIKVKGCNLYFTVQGQGIPILFIHPPALTHFNFEYQMKELSKDFQVIAFDIRGHGRSAFSEQPLTYPLIAEDIKQILDHLEINKAFICGYSSGGTIALEFMLSEAYRAYGGIVISGMSEVSDDHLKKLITLASKLAKSKALSVVALSTSWTNTGSISSFWKMLKEENKGNAKNIEEYYRYSLSYNCTNRLENINMPTLLIYGEKDQQFRRYAKCLHEKLPQSVLKWIPGTKHNIPTKSPNELNELIREFIYSHKDHL